MSITKVGDFYFLSARNGEDMVKVKWDNHNTVYVTLSGDHSNGISGMCGNYDDNPAISSKLYLENGQ